MLKSFPLLSVVTLLALASLAIPTASPQANSAAKSPTRAGNETLVKAKAVYQRDCALCHGDSGNGKTDLGKDMQLTMADWTDSKSLANQTDQQLFSIIRNGKDKMPSEDVGRAKDDEVHALVAYIRSLGKDQPSSAAAPAAPAEAPATAPAPGPGH
ncbi:MAG TPA: cytochrome c [Terracidiphilus sp.]|jgi:mono/diheme cytochrome c family protein|nr:cytochrome c [Terracidiphilus sp.]